VMCFSQKVQAKKPTLPAGKHNRDDDVIIDTG